MPFSNVEDFSALTDAEVLARASREPALFALLVRRYEAALLRRARTILADPEEAKEAVQDAFTKMYLYADKYHAQEGASFSSWMYTILNRVAYTKYQSRKAAHDGVVELELGTGVFESQRRHAADLRAHGAAVVATVGRAGYQRVGQASSAVFRLGGLLL